MATRKLEIVLSGDAQGALRAFKEVEQGAGGTATKLQGLGGTLSKTLTPAAIAVGAVFKQSFQEWDGGFDALRAGTGATGKELDALGESMKRVGGSVTQPLSQVGQVMADVATRTGLTGPPLENLTKQLLDLGRLGQDVSSETMTRTFGDWGIAAEDSAGALDKLFRASQATGPSMETLGSLLTQYGAPLRQLGFSFEESAALLGKFEKEGVNTELVLGSMRIALGQMAREGEPAQETFKRVTEQIKNAGSASEANALALELFGARAGPDMAAAIREGRFELGDLVSQISTGGETIQAAAKDTLDWGDKLSMLKNQVHGVLGPVGELGMGVAGVAAGIGPLLLGLGHLVPAIKAVGLALKGALLSPIGLVVIAVAGLAYLIITHWDTIKRVTLDLWDKVKAWTGDAMSAIRNGVIGMVQFVVDKILWWAETIVGAAATAFGWVPGIGPKLKEAEKKLGEFRDETNRALEGIKDKTVNINVIRMVSERKRDEAWASRGRGDGPGGPIAPRGGKAVDRVRAILPSYPGLRITNTYRTPEHNRRVGGSPTSLHMDKVNPAVDIGGPMWQLDRFHAALRAAGGWRELIWRAPGHFDHVHAAHKGEFLSSSAPGWRPGLATDERLRVLQVGERVIPKGGTGAGAPVEVHHHWHIGTFVGADERALADLIARARRKGYVGV